MLPSTSSWQVQFSLRPPLAGALFIGGHGMGRSQLLWTWAWLLSIIGDAPSQTVLVEKPFVLLYITNGFVIKPFVMFIITNGLHLEPFVKDFFPKRKKGSRQLGKWESNPRPKRWRVEAVTSRESSDFELGCLIILLIRLGTLINIKNSWKLKISLAQIVWTYNEHLVKVLV